MSLYPRVAYMYYGLTEPTRLHRTVMINGYQQAISHGAFTSLMSNVPYDMQQGNVKYGGRVYDHIYFHRTACDLKFDQECEERIHKKHNIPMMIVVDETPIDLYDWYQEIGYDKKKKHFNGVTLKRHIINCIAAEKEVTND